jgi:hypothetical protein
MSARQQGRTFGICCVLASLLLLLLLFRVMYCATLLT